MSSPPPRPTSTPSARWRGSGLTGAAPELPAERPALGSRGPGPAGTAGPAGRAVPVRRPRGASDGRVRRRGPVRRGGGRAGAARGPLRPGSEHHPPHPRLGPGCPATGAASATAPAAVPVDMRGALRRPGTRGGGAPVLSAGGPVLGTGSCRADAPRRRPREAAACLAARAGARGAGVRPRGLPERSAVSGCGRAAGAAPRGGPRRGHRRLGPRSRRARRRVPCGGPPGRTDAGRRLHRRPSPGRAARAGATAPRARARWRAPGGAPAAATHVRAELRSAPRAVLQRLADARARAYELGDVAAAGGGGRRRLTGAGPRRAGDPAGGGGRARPMPALRYVVRSAKTDHGRWRPGDRAGAGGHVGAHGGGPRRRRARPGRRRRARR